MDPPKKVYLDPETSIIGWNVHYFVGFCTCFLPAWEYSLVGHLKATQKFLKLGLPTMSIFARVELDVLSIGFSDL